MQLADAVLLGNNSQSEFTDSKVYTVKAKGVTIHEIDWITAWHEATRMQIAAAASDLPITKAMAGFFTEGLGDPNAENRNTGKNSDGTPRSNPTNSEEGVDLGCCQLKVGYLIGPHLLPDVSHARAFALNPDKAIPYYCSLMAGKVQIARHLIATTPSPEPRYKDDFMVATAIYNEGFEGFIKRYYTPGIWLHHCTAVQDWERWFAEHLVLPSFYPLTV